MDNFCAFILTHGRPDAVHTYKLLTKLGYTGKVYFIVDDEDTTVQKYIDNFGADKVIIFNKKEMADKIDEANNFDNRKVIVHARNYCFIAARKLGIQYFIQLDDDYTEFRYRVVNETYITKNTGKTNITKIFEILLNFYKKTNLTSISMAQGGDFIGGANCGMLTNYIKTSRKCMNSFICSTDRPFQFTGSINEDVNTYTLLQSRGLTFLTIPFVGLEQMRTQAQSGGMTDAYSSLGTYVKSFTSVILHPSSVKVGLMGVKNKRLHHRIKWKYTTPMIISEDYKNNDNTHNHQAFFDL